MKEQIYDCQMQSICDYNSTHRHLLQQIFVPKKEYIVGHTCEGKMWLPN